MRLKSNQAGIKMDTESMAGFENIEITLLGGGTQEHAKRIVQEAVSEYPEVKTFDPYIPAYGIWARHVKNLVLKNVIFHLKSRSAIGIYL